MGHVRHLDIGQKLKQLHRQMLPSAVAGRSEINFAGLRLAQRNEVLDGMGGKIVADHEHEGEFCEHRDRFEVVDRIIR